MRPTWRVAGAAALFAALEWYGATSEVAWLFLLAAWVLALTIASLGYAIWNGAGLGMNLSMRTHSAAGDSPIHELPEPLLRASPLPGPLFEGDSAELEVVLSTAGASRGPAWVDGTLAGANVAGATGLVPRKGWRDVHALGALRRGPLGATGWVLRTSDPLGFWRSRRAYPDREVGLVLPRFTSLTGNRETRELEASLASPRAGSGNEVLGIRDYRPGDSLRRIHWRSSARHGTLVVREYEPPGVRTLSIYLDPAPRTREIADQIARVAASEAWDCIRDGGRVVLWAPGLEASAAPGDLWSQLGWLARYPDLDEGAMPRMGDEVVVVTASSDPELVSAARSFRMRRVWFVGDGEADVDGMTLRRVGTTWPL